MEEADFNADSDDDAGVAEFEIDENDELGPLKKEYLTYLTQLEDNSELGKFIDIFTKLFETLCDFRDEKNKLIEEKSNLESSLNENKELLDKAYSKNESDKLTIEELTEKVQNSQKLIDGTHAREQTSQETMLSLRNQIASLNVELNLAKQLAETDISKKGPAVFKNSLERDNIVLEEEVTRLKEKLSNALEYQDVLEQSATQCETRLKEVTNALEESNTKLESCIKNKSFLEKQHESQFNEAEKKDLEVEALKQIIASDKQILTRLENERKTQDGAKKNCFKEIMPLNKKIFNLTTETNKLRNDMETFSREKNILHKLLEEKQIEKSKLNVTIEQLREEILKFECHVGLQRQQKKTLRKEKVQALREIAMLTMNINQQNKITMDQKHAIDKIERERFILNEKLKKIKDEGNKQDQLVKEYLKDIKDFAVAHRKETDNAKKLKVLIANLETERLMLQKHDTIQDEKLNQFKEDLQQKCIEVQTLKQTIADQQKALTAQENYLSDLKLKRNCMRQKMEITKENNDKLNLKLGIETSQNAQYNEQIREKNKLIVKTERILRDTEKHKDKVIVELQNVGVSNQELKFMNEDIQKECKKLNQENIRKDRSLTNKNETIAKLIREKDLLNLQLSKNNDEISLLYEKVKIYVKSLQAGQIQYKQRLDDIKLLKLEIKRLRQQNSLLVQSVNNSVDLKQEILHLEREIARERLKSKALQDEFHKPLNIHRWRLLEGSDPDKNLLIQKNNYLQKKFFQKCKELIYTEDKLKDLDAMNKKLQRFLRVHPHPNAVETIKRNEYVIQSRTKQLKSMMVQLSMSEIQNMQTNATLIEKKKQLQEARNKLLRERKQRTKAAQALHAISQVLNPSVPKTAIKCTGGGYRMAASVRPANL